MEILYNNRQDQIEITDSNKKLIMKAIKECLAFEKKSNNYEISISFVTNEEIKKLNNEYRNIDKETDVLSFPMDDDEFEDDRIMLGDIVISTHKIIEQANNFGHTVEREMIFLIVHSMLHLLGYDHIEEEERKIMRTKEREIMNLLKIYR